MNQESAQAQLQVVLSFADQGMAQALGALQGQLGGFTSGQQAATMAASRHHSELLRGTAAMKGYYVGLGTITSILGRAAGFFGFLTGGIMALSVKMKENDSILHAYNDSMQGLGIKGQESLDRLTKASQGLVPAVTLMQRTNTAMSFLGNETLTKYVETVDKVRVGEEKLKDSTGVLERLLTGAMASARSTGMTVEQTYSQMLLGAAKFDTQLLRSAGIQVTTAQANAAWAAKTGHAVQTEQDKVMAFLDFVVTKGEENVKRFGISTGGINTQLQRISTAFQDMSLKITTAFDKGLTRPILKSAADLAQFLGRVLGPAVDYLGEALKRIPEPVLVFVGSLGSLTTLFQLLAPLLSTVLPMFPALGASLGVLGAPIALVVAGLLTFASVIRGTDDGLAKLGARWDEIEQKWANTPGVGTVVSNLQELGSTVAGIVGDIGMVLEDIGQAALDFFGISMPKNLEDLHADILGFLDPLQDAADAVHFLTSTLAASSKIDSFADRLAQALKTTLRVYPEYSQALKFAINITETWGVAVEKVIVAFGSLLREVGPIILKLLGYVMSFADWVSKHSDVIVFALVAIAAQWTLMKIVMVGSGIIEFITYFGQTMGAILVGMQVGMGATTISATVMWTAITGGIALLIAAGFMLWANWDSVMGWWQEAWTNLAAALLDTFAVILEGLANVAGGHTLVGDAIIALIGLIPGMAPVSQAAAMALGGVKDQLDQLAGSLHMTAFGLRLAGAAAKAARQDAGFATEAMTPSVSWTPEEREANKKLYETKDIAPFKPGAPPGDDGKGGKAKKGKGDGAAKKDPLAEAYQAISSIASAVSAGIDAINKLWREWRGSPGEDVWDEVFDTFDMMVERMAKLASGVSPEKAAQGKAFADMIGGYASALTGIVELGGKMARGRLPSEASLKALFTIGKQITEFADEFTGDFLSGDFKAGGKSKTGLEEAVKKIRLTTDVAGVLGAWADAFGKTADSVVKLTGRRIDVNWGQLSGFALGALDLAVAMKDHVASATDPRVLIDVRDTVDLAGPMFTAMAGAADAAGKVQGTRWPDAGTMASLGDFLIGVMDLSDILTGRMHARHGERLLVVLEDIGLTGDALAKWLPSIGEAATASRALLTARFDLDLQPALDFITEMMDFASGLTEALRGRRAMPGGGDDLRDHLDELGMVGEKGKAWIDLIAGIATTSDTLARLGLGRALGQKIDLGPVYDFLVELLGLQNGVYYAFTKGGKFDANQASDIAALGQVMKGWLEVLAAIAEPLGAMRAMQAHLQWGSGRIDLHPIFEMLMQIGNESGRIWSAVQNALGNLAPDALGTSGQIAVTFKGWLEALAVVSDVLSGLRLGRAAGFNPADLTRFFDVLGQIGGESWKRFQAAMTMPGGASLQGSSQQIASTLSAWVSLVAGADDLMNALRLARALDPGTAKEQIAGFFDILQQIAIASWEMIKGSAGKPGFAELHAESQQAAASVAAWLGTVTQIAQATRSLDLTRPVRPEVWVTISDILSGLNRLAHEAAKDWATEDDPGAALERASGAAQAMGDFFSVIADMATGTRDIASMIEPTAREWAAVERSMVEVWDIAKRMVGRSGLSDIPQIAEEQSKQWAAWASMEQAAASALGAVAGLGLENYLPPLERRWNQLESASQRVLEIARRLAGVGQSAPGEGEVADDQAVAEKMSAWSSMVSAAVGGLSDIASLVIDATELRAIPADAERMLRESLESALDIVDVLRKGWERGKRDPQRDEELATSFADMLSGIVEPLADVWELLQSMAGVEVPQGGVAKLEQMVPFIQRAAKLFADLSEPLFDLMDSFLYPGGGSGLAPDPDELERARREQERTWQHVSAYASMVGDSAGALGDIIDTMVSLKENLLNLGDLEPVRGQVERFIRQAVDLWTHLADSLTDLDDPAARTELERLATFAGRIGDIVSPLSDIASTMADLLDLKWEEFEAADGVKGRRLRDLELGTSFLSDISRGMHAMFDAMVAFEATLPELLDIPDPAKLDAQMQRLGAHAEVVGKIAEMVGKLSDPLSSWFNQTGGKGFSWGLFVNRYGNESTTARRTNRAEWYAEQLKQGIIRAAKAIIDALNTITMPQGVDAKTKALSDAVDGIASAIERVIQIGEIDTKGTGPGTFLDKVRIMMEAAGLLSDGFTDFTVPDGIALYAEAIEASVDALADAIDRIGEIDFSNGNVDTFLSAVGRLYAFFSGDLLDLGGAGMGTGENGPGGRGRGSGRGNPGLGTGTGWRMIGGGHGKGGKGGGFGDQAIDFNPLAGGGSLTDLFKITLPTIVIEMPTVEVNITNNIAATITMDGTEQARVSKGLGTKRHVYDPGQPSTS